MPSLGWKIELCIRRVGGHAGGPGVIFVSSPVFPVFFVYFVFRGLIFILSTTVGFD